MTRTSLLQFWPILGNSVSFPFIKVSQRVLSFHWRSTLVRLYSSCYISFCHHSSTNESSWHSCTSLHFKANRLLLKLSWLRLYIVQIFFHLHFSPRQLIFISCRPLGFPAVVLPHVHQWKKNMYFNDFFVSFGSFSDSDTTYSCQELKASFRDMSPRSHLSAGQIVKYLIVLFLSQWPKPDRFQAA